MIPHGSPESVCRRRPFGPWIRARREQLGIGLRRAATMAGVTPTQLSHWERGTRWTCGSDRFDYPDVDELKRLASVLQVSWSRLCDLTAIDELDANPELVYKPGMTPMTVDPSEVAHMLGEGWHHNPNCTEETCVCGAHQPATLGTPAEEAKAAKEYETFVHDAEAEEKRTTPLPAKKK